MPTCSTRLPPSGAAHAAGAVRVVCAVDSAIAAVGTASPITGTSSRDIHRRRIATSTYAPRGPVSAPLASRYPQTRPGYHEPPGPTYLDPIAAKSRNG